MGSGAGKSSNALVATGIEASVVTSSDADLTATFAGLTAASRERLLVALGEAHGMKSAVLLLSEELEATKAKSKKSDGAEGQKDSEVVVSLTAMDGTVVAKVTALSSWTVKYLKMQGNEQVGNCKHIAELMLGPQLLDDEQTLADVMCNSFGSSITLQAVFGIPEGMYKGRYTYDDGIMGIYDDGNDIVYYKTTSTYLLQVRGDGAFQLDLHVIIQGAAGPDEKYTIEGASVFNKIVFPNEWEISIALKDDMGLYLTSTENKGRMKPLLLEALRPCPEGSYKGDHTYKGFHSQMITSTYLLQIRGDGTFQANLALHIVLAGGEKSRDESYMVEGENVFNKTAFSNGWEISIELKDDGKVYLASTEDHKDKFVTMLSPA